MSSESKAEGHPLTAAAKPPVPVEVRNKISVAAHELGASDADLAAVQLLIEHTAQYILANKLCACVHCCVAYCNGKPELSAALITSIHTQSGVPCLLRAHVDAEDGE